jgi:hypothetical protein
MGRGMLRHRLKVNERNLKLVNHSNDDLSSREDVAFTRRNV